MAAEVWRDGRVDDQPDEGLGRPEPASQEDVCRDEYASRVTEGRPWEKVIRPALRRGLAENAVARHGVSIALACRTFDVSETCYRYSPLLSDENEEIADLLVGLTAARKTWGFGLCWSCSAYVPVSQLIYAALRSKAKGLFPPSEECRRLGL